MVEVLKPEFFIVAPEDGSEHYQHQTPQLKKDKVKARRKVDGGPGLGKQEARQRPATANTDRARNRNWMPSWLVPTNASPPGSTS